MGDVGQLGAQARKKVGERRRESYASMAKAGQREGRTKEKKPDVRGNARTNHRGQQQGESGAGVTATNLEMGRGTPCMTFNGPREVSCFRDVPHAFQNLIPASSGEVLRSR